MKEANAVTFREDDVGSRARVTTDEASEGRVLPGR